MRITLAKMAVWWLPSKYILAWASRPLRRINRFVDGAEIASVSAAVDWMGAQSRLNAACLPRALAAQAMLRRRGVTTRLVLGVKRDAAGLAAHAWIELGETIVVGGAHAPTFTRVAEFGPQSA